MSGSPFAFRFWIKEDGAYRYVAVVAASGQEACDRLFAQHPKLTSWDFATWGDGTYRKAVAA